MSSILILDDDALFGQLVKTVFGLEGYQAELVASPEELLPLARRIRPMLVLMDVHFPHQDTLELVRDLRADSQLQGLPVLMTSGMDRYQECMDAGADAFLLKPFHPDELMAVIRSMVPREGTNTTYGKT